MDENPYRPPETVERGDRLSTLLRSLRIWTVLAWIGAGVVTTIVLGGIAVICFWISMTIHGMRSLG